MLMAEAGSGPLSTPADVGAQDPDDSRRRRVDPRDHPQDRALAGAAGSQHTQDLATEHVQLGTLERGRVTLSGAVDPKHVAQLDQGLGHVADRRLGRSSSLTAQPTVAHMMVSAAPRASNSSQGRTAIRGGSAAPLS